MRRISIFAPLVTIMTVVLASALATPASANRSVYLEPTAPTRHIGCDRAPQRPDLTGLIVRVIRPGMNELGPASHGHRHGDGEPVRPRTARRVA